ncbi:nuclear transport factor 2 family protein [Microlunatus soli]|uniref:SnoaL-like domain-containing protein n=1 Tax=Microlunatus soli TaxID=630515 RepID=A0A1H1U369_9ACTN|nr:nuclear transport factor 2 family protein [Microlunatus soli]SDS66781.1 SnoaL-like domain-containing protein [Microlunatus soli]
MTDDRLRIHELINLHGHLMDEGRFDRLDELVTADVVYDVTALGGGVLVGPQAMTDAGRQLGDRNPVGHLVTNIVVVALEDDVASAVSKGLGVLTDGSVAAVVYEDELVRTPEGWRIARRVVLPRRRPLHPSRP